jgi:hypothetical protein
MGYVLGGKIEFGIDWSGFQVDWSGFQVDWSGFQVDWSENK